MRNRRIFLCGRPWRFRTDDRRNLRRRRLVLRRPANPPRRTRRQDLAELPRLRADGHRRPDEAAPDARSVPDDARSPTRRPRSARGQRHGRPEPLARRRGSLSRRDGGLFRRDDGADGPFALGLRSRAWPAGRVLFRPFPETPNSTASPALPAAAPRFRRRGRRGAYRHRRVHYSLAGRRRRSRGQDSRRQLDRRSAHSRRPRHQHRRHDATLDQWPLRFELRTE